MSVFHNEQKQVIGSSLDKILKHITDEGDLLSPLGEFLLIERERSPRGDDGIQLMFQKIEEKVNRIQHILKRNSKNLEENQRHLLLIDRFKEKFLPGVK